MNNKPIGILGGTFDPIHHGHLRLALEIVRSLPMSSLRLMPLHTPPHRKPPVASVAQRLAMLKLATEGVPGLEIDAREIHRTGVSYTIDTLKSMRSELQEAPLLLIMGMDAFQSFNTWREWNAITDYSHIILVDRPGSHTEITHPELQDFFCKHASDNPSVLNERAGAILKLEIPMLDISSTQIRQQIAEGRDPRFLLPDKVIKYIKQETLYH